MNVAYQPNSFEQPSVAGLRDMFFKKHYPPVEDEIIEEKDANGKVIKRSSLENKNLTSQTSFSSVLENMLDTNKQQMEGGSLMDAAAAPDRKADGTQAQTTITGAKDGSGWQYNSRRDVSEMSTEDMLQLQRRILNSKPKPMG